jgi:hypothetical protein
MYSPQASCFLDSYFSVLDPLRFRFLLCQMIKDSQQTPSSPPLPTQSLSLAKQLSFLNTWLATNSTPVSPLYRHSNLYELFSWRIPWDLPTGWFLNLPGIYDLLCSPQGYFRDSRLSFCLFPVLCLLRLGRGRIKRNTDYSRVRHALRMTGNVFCLHHWKLSLVCGIFNPCCSCLYILLSKLGLKGKKSVY